MPHDELNWTISNLFHVHLIAQNIHEYIKSLNVLWNYTDGRVLNLFGKLNEFIQILQTCSVFYIYLQNCFSCPCSELNLLSVIHTCDPMYSVVLSYGQVSGIEEYGVFWCLALHDLHFFATKRYIKV